MKMKDLILIVSAAMITVSMFLAVMQYNEKANELAEITRIEMLTNDVENEAIQQYLSTLNDEQITKEMGL